MLLTGDRAARRAPYRRVLRIVRDLRRGAARAKNGTRAAANEDGLRPMVVGDGINDCLALKAGAVGVAMGAQGTDVALASADLALMTNDLRRLGPAFA